MRVHMAIRGVMTLVIMVGVLVLFGCESSDNGGGDGFGTAASAALENQVFAFADGAAFGLPGQSVTLTIRDFDNDGDGNPNTAPFVLKAAADTASGTITIGSCNLLIQVSTFDPVAFPKLQPQQTVVLDPCEAHADDGRLRVENAATDETSTSGVPTLPDDLDGLPELTHMLVHNGMLYVVLQHLDFTTGFPPVSVAPGEVAVIDPATDTVVTVIQLNGRNPFSALQFSPSLNRILVSTVGDFGVNDGGIEAINPETNMVDPGFIIDEVTIGGDITHFQIVSTGEGLKGFAIVAGSDFTNSMVSFDPVVGEVLKTLVGPLNAFLSHFAINNRGELYLAVTDITVSPPEVRIFDTNTDEELPTVNVGALPSSFVLFIEDGDGNGIPPTTDVAFIIATDFETGSYSVVDLAAQDTFNDLGGLGSIHSDATARFFGGKIYVVNRFGVDSIQIVDPQLGYMTPQGAEVSVGNGLNPQDIAFVDANKAYVSRLDSSALLVINPMTLDIVGEVDLIALTK
ncbi:MAG: hypothetical protein O7G88_19100 [bacterium]|nr:hypothetical protein [bacterium]